MSIMYTEKKFRLVGTSPLLGSSPKNKEVFSEFIATKAKEGEERARAHADVENIPELEEGDNGKETIFYRDTEAGYPILKAYQILGFLKEAAKGLSDQTKLKQATSKIDKFVFIVERNLPIYRDGERIEKVDGYLERPLRAETMQGPRVALAKSEVINEGWSVEFTVRVLPNSATKTSSALDMDLVETLLEYGQFKGLLQWRNGGYGQFEFEEVK